LGKMLYADIVKIAWPSVVELTLTQLASMVDLMMVGGLGAWALTSVGLTVQPKFLLMTIFMAMNVGATAMAARYKGAGDQEKANLILRQALLLTLIISVISSITGYVFAEKLILFMGAAEEKTLHGGTIYLKIQMVGFTFMALTSTITAALRGVGNSRPFKSITNLLYLSFLIFSSINTLASSALWWSSSPLSLIVSTCPVSIKSIFTKSSFLHIVQAIILKWKGDFLS
jgi:Na+-driven multidrug efflux pump